MTTPKPANPPNSRARRRAVRLALIILAVVVLTVRATNLQLRGHA